MKALSPISRFPSQDRALALAVLLPIVTGTIAARAQENGTSPDSGPNPPPPHLREALWPDGTSYPAVCLGKPNWFACAVPTGSDPAGSEIQPPRIVFGERGVEPELLHFEQALGLCLFAVEPVPEDSTPLPVSSRRRLAPGTRLQSLASGSIHRSCVLGKDFHHGGEALPRPLLRIRVETPGGPCDLPGTPLLDERGEVAGLLTHREAADGPRKTHAIPGPFLRKMLWEIETHHRSGPVLLGLHFDIRSSAPEVVGVKSPSPASRAGLKEGDILLSLDGTDVEQFLDVYEISQCLPAGRPTEVKVLRGLEEITLEIIPEFKERGTMGEKIPEGNGPE